MRCDARLFDNYFRSSSEPIGRLNPTLASLCGITRNYSWALDYKNSDQCVDVTDNGMSIAGRAALDQQTEYAP